MRSGRYRRKTTWLVAVITMMLAFCASAEGRRIETRFGEGVTTGRAWSYVVVDTGQTACYDNSSEIPCPRKGASFYGQDAQYAGNGPSNRDNGDGTISDLNTGLMWQKTPDLENKSTWAEALQEAGSFDLAGYDDWRLPTIKELYSFIDFTGTTRFSASASTPYIATEYFDFVYGDTKSGQRFIDAQYWSSTEYVGVTMNGDATAFGVNFADGRIKGYPTERGPNGSPFEAFVRYVRGNESYGVNNFVDNGYGTVTDLATGLMWAKAESSQPMNWEEALGYAEDLETAGYDDWRLPTPRSCRASLITRALPTPRWRASVRPRLTLSFR